MCRQFTFSVGNIWIFLFLKIYPMKFLPSRLAPLFFQQLYVILSVCQAL